MQALGIVYLLMFLPVSSYIKEDILSVYGEAGSGQEEEDAGEQVSRQNGPGRAVALTFDDGPDSETTPVLLEGLRDRNVRCDLLPDRGEYREGQQSGHCRRKCMKTGILSEIIRTTMWICLL